MDRTNLVREKASVWDAAGLERTNRKALMLLWQLLNPGEERAVGK